MQEIWLPLIGCLVGVVIGMTGVGGGSLMTPLLIGVFHIPPHIAVGTDLLFAAITKVVGSASLARRRVIPWREVRWISAGSLPAALLTVAVVAYLGPTQASTKALITLMLGAVLVLAGAVNLYRLWAPAAAHTEVEANQSSEQLTRARRLKAIAFGALIGVLVSITSVGAGALGVAAIALLFPYLSAQRMVAADLAYAVPLSLVAGLGYASMQAVDWSLLGWLLLGSIPGIYLGSHAHAWVPPRASRGLLGAVLVGVGITMINR